MNNFKRINEVLHYIDNNINQDLNFEQVANQFHFSSYYFHRIFSAIVGKTITEYIRDRRLDQACLMLAHTRESLISICFECGFNSSQAFSRVFKKKFGMPPSEYRKKGINPHYTTVEELIYKFTNRLKGGVYVNPRIMQEDELLIVGITGDGSKTAEIWQRFINQNPKPNHIEDNGYEIRIYEDGKSICHVGFRTKADKVSKPYTLIRLPASKYAVFDVYVKRGYDSENSAMEEWLKNNKQGYVQRYYKGNPYVVEFYDDRFTAEESIVEIWVPIKKGSD